jgi:Zn-dependent protease
MLNIAPSMLIAHLFVLLTAFVVHEFAHAWTANFFGDDTPRLNGRLTLNPLSHLDIMGSILLLVAGFGWAKPVPVNPYVLNQRSPAAYMLVALAGPMSNFLMAMVAAIPFRLGVLSVYDAQLAIATQESHILPTVPQLLYVFIYINLLLMIFNLLPIAPLDGEKIATFFVPAKWSQAMNAFRPFGPLILLALVMLGGFQYIIGPPLGYLMGLLVG